MLGSLAQKRDEDGNREAYFIAVEGVTRYALYTAVTNILQGSLGHVFFPNPVELRQQCDAAMRPIHEQGQRELIRRQMRAETVRRRARREPTPDEKARVQAMVDGVHRRCDSIRAETARREPPLLDAAFWDRVNAPRGARGAPAGEMPASTGVEGEDP